MLAPPATTSFAGSRVVPAVEVDEDERSGFDEEDGALEELLPLRRPWWEEGILATKQPGAPPPVSAGAPKRSRRRTTRCRAEWRKRIRVRRGLWQIELRYHDRWCRWHSRGRRWRTKRRRWNSRVRTERRECLIVPRCPTR